MFGSDEMNPTRGVVLIMEGIGGPVIAKGFEREFGIYELLLKLTPIRKGRAMLAFSNGDWHRR